MTNIKYHLYFTVWVFQHTLPQKKIINEKILFQNIIFSCKSCIFQTENQFDTFEKHFIYGI